MNILLSCASGMSTSLLAEEMKKAAEKEGLELKVWEVPVLRIKDHLDNVDVILIGPQIRYRLSELKKMGAERNIPVEVINSIDYGTMNGKKIIEFAMKLNKGGN